MFHSIRFAVWLVCSRFVIILHFCCTFANVLQHGCHCVGAVYIVGIMHYFEKMSAITFSVWLCIRKLLNRFVHFFTQQCSDIFQIKWRTPAVLCKISTGYYVPELFENWTTFDDIFVWCLSDVGQVKCMLFRMTALLVTSKEADRQLLQNLCISPVHLFDESVMESAIACWEWLLAARSDLRAQVMRKYLK